jgi:hypothetical protein
MQMLAGCWFGLAALALATPAQAGNGELDLYLEQIRTEYVLPALAAAVGRTARSSRPEPSARGALHLIAANLPP